MKQFYPVFVIFNKAKANFLRAAAMCCLLLLVQANAWAITGTLTVCTGATTTLSDASSGGTWSSGNTSIATVGLSSGEVTGIAAGTADITYTPVTGSPVSVVVTVNTAGTITGPDSICIFTPLNIVRSLPGGTWDADGAAGSGYGYGMDVDTFIMSTPTLGVANIYYTLGGCTSVHHTTVYIPAPITPTASYVLSPGSTVTLPMTLYDFSYDTTIATVGLTSGVVTGMAPGSTLVSNVNTGCYVFATYSITVTPGDVGPITGTLAICQGSTTTLSDTSVGGSWSSGDTSIATIDASGAVTGLSSGMAYITYALPGGAFAFTVVTVDASPTLAITGSANLCVGYTTTLSDSIGSLISAISGYGWSSSDTTVATVNPFIGIVTGVSAGTAIISSYIVTDCGVVTATRIVTVNAASVGTITGTSTVCAGSTTTLSSTGSGGGIWTSFDTSIATVNSSSGVVTGVTAGVVSIDYSLPSCSASIGHLVTVNPLPDAGAITGTATLCPSATATLSDSVSGGAWSSGNTAVATIGSTGVVAAVGAGTALISYSVTGSCGTAYATTIVTVNAVPTVSAITGGSAVNVGSTLSLSDSISGGTWSASNSHATVAADGTVTGVSFGSVTISYVNANGCGSATATKTINVTTPITGNLSICAGTTTTLSNSISGGTWTSSASVAILYITPSAGVVTGVAAGTGVVTYTKSGISMIAVVTVNPLPPNISGAAAVCIGLTTTLTDATGGGTWSSNNASIASADTATGIITGVATGATTITYTLPTGCYKTQPMTVRPSPAAISGSSIMCEGSVTTYTDATPGGMMWSSSNTAVATIGSISGVLTSHSAGTSTITYTLSTGCIATKIITVIAVPSSISGPYTMCPGDTVTFTNPVSGGSWASTVTSIATINPVTGELASIASGITQIRYTVAGCTASHNMTVNPLPGLITGIKALCTGSITSLGSSTGGGTWSSSSAGIATVGSTGLVTATGTGTATISYVLPTGCMRTAVVTVSIPPAITGPTSLCIGNPTTFTSSASAGYWTSSNSAVAPINITTGIATGMAAGTANITFSISSYCRSSVMVTVGSSMATISGPSSVCTGSSITLSDATTGGVWTSSNTATATIDASTGVITTVSPGTTMISYSSGSGCYQTKLITVGGGLGSITGATGLCVGASTTYLSTSPTTGIGWSSSNTAVASVGALSGVVTGTGVGIATITFTPYAFSTFAGCTAVKTVTVDAVPSVAPITGPLAVQVGHTITLADATPGGVWSSNNTARATVSAGGVVTGVTVPSATISYTMTNGACAYSLTKIVLIMLARPEMTEPDGLAFTLYPNPTTGSFTVSTSEAGTFVIYTMDGREVLRSGVAEGLNPVAMPKGIAAGIYMCRFNGNGGSNVMVRLVYE